MSTSQYDRRVFYICTLLDVLLTYWGMKLGYPECNPFLVRLMVRVGVPIALCISAGIRFSIGPFMPTSVVVTFNIVYLGYILPVWVYLISVHYWNGGL